jgi:ribosomal protein L24
MSETPKFKPGDEVFWGNEDRSLWIKSRFDTELAIGPAWWLLDGPEGRLRGWAEESKLRHVPVAVPDPPKFKPGDLAIIDDKNELRNGATVYLQERRLGSIAGRPYWMVRLEPDNPPWYTFPVTEDSLIPAPPEESTPDADLFAPSPRLGPREPEDVVMKAPTTEPDLQRGDLVMVMDGWTKGELGIVVDTYDPPGFPAYFGVKSKSTLPGVTILARDQLKATSIQGYIDAMKAPSCYDGQANTSGIGQRQPEREDVLKKGDLVIVTGGWLKGEPAIIDGLFGSAEGKAIACYVKTKRCPGVGVVLRDDLKVASINEFFVAMRSEPTVYTVQEGITRWQQADPTHRRANVVLGGHTVEVFLTVLPGLATQRVKFDSMFSADATVAILEDAAKAMVDHATAEVSVTMARNPAFKFSEDSGDIDP